VRFILQDVQKPFILRAVLARTGAPHFTQATCCVNHVPLEWTLYRTSPFLVKNRYPAKLGRQRGPIREPSQEPLDSPSLRPR
jgi:hypothetical protein